MLDIKQLKKDYEAEFKGWNFSYLKNRCIEEKPNWNYIKIARKFIKNAGSVIDMATGGGEVFSEIMKKSKPKKAVAMEGYKPNVLVAVKKLEKYNVKVFYANETKKLPFNNGEFSLVLNRHGGMNENSIKEIYRILMHGGYFITQQVDGRTLNDLQKEFGSKSRWRSNILRNVTKQLKQNGFEIIKSKEWKGKTYFKDIGALVYFLKAVPWIVDGFSIEKHMHTLERLQKTIEKKGKLEFSSRRFLIIASKP